MGRSDSGGRFRIDRTGYTAPADCTVDVNDGSATPRVATLSGCTVRTAAATAAVRPGRPGPARPGERGERDHPGDPVLVRGHRPEPAQPERRLQLGDQLVVDVRARS